MGRDARGLVHDDHRRVREDHVERHIFFGRQGHVGRGGRDLHAVAFSDALAGLGRTTVYQHRLKADQLLPLGTGPVRDAAVPHQEAIEPLPGDEWRDGQDACAARRLAAYNPQGHTLTCHHLTARLTGWPSRTRRA
jgi:hypothetical protein